VWLVTKVFADEFAAALVEVCFGSPLDTKETDRPARIVNVRLTVLEPPPVLLAVRRAL
jgi:hypothetical protein